MVKWEMKAVVEKRNWIVVSSSERRVIERRGYGSGWTSNGNLPESSLFGRVMGDGEVEVVCGFRPGGADLAECLALVAESFASTTRGCFPIAPGLAFDLDCVAAIAGASLHRV